MLPARTGKVDGRIIGALLIALISIVSYFFMSAENPVTGEKQRVGLSVEQEIALGRKAAPTLIRQHGGVHPAAEHQQRVTDVGRKLLAELNRQVGKTDRKNPYKFDFHLLNDNRTINAFALPGGQVFITAALYRQLSTEAQLAGVLGHEIGHVIARHGAQQLAKRKLTAGLAGAAEIASGDERGGAVAQAVANLVNMRYGREHEHESDRWAVRLMPGAGYDPRAMIEVMEVLARASRGGTPEFLSTHPKPANRVEYIKEVIAEEYPKGLPEGLSR